MSQQFYKVTSTKVGIGTAHSKIILMGEHAVVYDYPAIAIPFPAANTTVQISPNDHGRSFIQSRFYTGPLDAAPEILDNLRTAIQVARSSLKFPQQDIDIIIESTIPAGRGMGSSAAVSVALVRALSNLYGYRIKDYQLQFIVNQAEVIAHESTSGLDTLITSTNRPVIYQKSISPVPFSIHMPAYLVVADSNQPGQTSEAVGKVRQLREAKPELTKIAMDAIGDMVQQATLAIEAQDVEELGRLMTYNHYYLNQLSVSNSQLDQIVNAAWLAGALGAKLTGGGLGGCVIAIARDFETANRIETAMLEAGAVQSWQLDLRTI